MAQEKDLFDLISSETERLENGRNHVEHLTAQSVGYRAEFASAVGKVLIRQLDHEEIYYSQLMDRAVVEFYTATTDGRNVKEATELIGFAHDILKDTDLGSRDNTNLNAIQDIPAAFHHIEIASMIYPPLRYKRLPVTKSSSSGFDGFFNLNAGAIKSILGHLKELKLFLEAELLSVRPPSCIRPHKSHQDFRTTPDNSTQTTHLQYLGRKRCHGFLSSLMWTLIVLFPQDLHQVSNVANLNDVFASKEDVGRAMGLVYPDLLLNESVDPLDLPQYEDGMLAILSAQVTRAL
ncbi:hypothetical protein BDR26DRAFT_867572 [Obelidium mucronatum]|nr:hypothetical protein BDR26DRAFT_867572 [Obelidium mucronatum]